MCTKLRFCSQPWWPQDLGWRPKPTACIHGYCTQFWAIVFHPRCKCWRYANWQMAFNNPWRGGCKGYDSAWYPEYLTVMTNPWKIHWSTTDLEIHRCQVWCYFRNEDLSGFHMFSPIVRQDDGNLSDVCAIAALCALLHFRKADVEVKGESAQAFAAEELLGWDVFFYRRIGDLRLVKGLHKWSQSKMCVEVSSCHDMSCYIQ